MCPSRRRPGGLVDAGCEPGGSIELFGRRPPLRITDRSAICGDTQWTPSRDRAQHCERGSRQQRGDLSVGDLDLGFDVVEKVQIGSKQPPSDIRARNRQRVAGRVHDPLGQGSCHADTSTSGERTEPGRAELSDTSRVGQLGEDEPAGLAQRD
jgi:hypothetical protein